MLNEVLYHVFKVYDYKDGELSSSTNLSKERFIQNIVYTFEGAFYEMEGSLNGVEKSVILYMLNKYISDKDFYSTYAGGGGFVGEMYYTKDNVMTHIGFSDILDDIADYIMINWVD